MLKSTTFRIIIVTKKQYLHDAETKAQLVPWKMKLWIPLEALDI